jgi:outer membrane receptor protein involved in Fe transport
MMWFKVLACILILVSSTYAQSQSQELPETIVKAERLIEDKIKVSIKAEALPSQVQIITKEDIERLDAKDFLDIFRKTAGINPSPYGQGEVANPFVIRGHGSSHGANVAVFIDGVPQNYRSGSFDSSWLTPELIERIEIIKGPFSALYGNYALGGVVNVITKRKDTSPSVSVSGGSFGAYRGLGLISNETWQSSTSLMSFEYSNIDGYRDNSDHRKMLFFPKITLPILDDKLSTRLSFYKSDWGAPGYLRIDDAKAGIVDRKSAVNLTDGGTNEHYTLAINYTQREGEKGLYMDAYIKSREWHRLSTFGLNQSESEDDRTIYGGKIYYNLMPNDRLAVTPGVEIRYDSIDTRRYPTTNGQRTGMPTQDWGVKQLDLSAFIQAQVNVIEQLKLVGGIRYDHFNIDVQNKVISEYSGKADTGIFTPRLGFVATPLKNLNIFANKGLGLRSPQPHEMSPNTIARAENFDLKPAQVHSWDVGFDTTLLEKLYFAFSYYQTEMEREIRRVGNETNIADSERDGYEVETKFYVMPELTLFANYAWLDSNWKDPVVAGQHPGQHKIPGLSEHLISGGIEVTKQTGKDSKLLLDVYYSYVSGGPYYVGTETTPRKMPAYDRYTVKATYMFRLV